MKLSIVNIQNQGDYTKEYVCLRVLEDCNLTNYLLCDSTYFSNNSVSNKLRHIYWFPDKWVKRGDFIWLYTGSGSKASWDNKEGTKTYAFYWNLNISVWNNEKDCGVLFEINNWTTKSTN